MKLSPSHASMCIMPDPSSSTHASIVEMYFVMTNVSSWQDVMILMHEDLLFFDAFPGATRNVVHVKLACNLLVHD